jgi:uncharacterized protein
MRCATSLYVSQLFQALARLLHAIAEFGLPPDHVHDAFNIFMTTGLGEDDRFFYLDHDAEQGDYVELFAELDRIAAISACPGASSGPQKRPPGIEIYRSLIRALGEG